MSFKIRVVLAVVVDNGRVLCIRRADNKQVALAGGCVERGERPEDALAREVGEELGLAVQDQYYLGSTEVENIKRRGGAPVVCHHYLTWVGCNPLLDSPGSFEPNREVDEVMWLTPEELEGRDDLVPSLLRPEGRALIAEAVRVQGNLEALRRGGEATSWRETLDRAVRR